MKKASSNAICRFWFYCLQKSSADFRASRIHTIYKSYLAFGSSFPPISGAQEPYSFENSVQWDPTTTLAISSKSLNSASSFCLRDFLSILPFWVYIFFGQIKSSGPVQRPDLVQLAPLRSAQGTFGPEVRCGSNKIKLNPKETAICSAVGYDQLAYLSWAWAKAERRKEYFFISFHVSKIVHFFSPKNRLKWPEILAISAMQNFWNFSKIGEKFSFSIVINGKCIFRISLRDNKSSGR